jgi:myo-inositol-1(or 4)-monophosphatase
MAYTMSKEELGEIYTFALHLGRRAGKILLDGVNKRTGDVSERSSEGEVQVEKMNAVDIVT